jgi:hypothetical protein
VPAALQQRALHDYIERELKPKGQAPARTGASAGRFRPSPADLSP